MPRTNNNDMAVDRRDVDSTTAEAVSYDPIDRTKWPGNVDPGNVNDALDLIATLIGVGAKHNLLDDNVHPDTDRDDPTEGSIIHGNAIKQWDEKVIGGDTKILVSDGTDLDWKDIDDFAADGAPDGAADHVMSYDNSAGIHKKVLLEDVAASGAPAAHKDSHDPQTGGDPLDCAAPSELAGIQAAGEGNADTFARSNHAHQIQHSIADNHLVTVDGAPNDDEYARFTADGIEGRTTVQVLADIGGVAAHAMLDGTVHTDSVADAVTRGSLIYGNATPMWDELVVGYAGQFLKTDAADTFWADIVEADITDLQAYALAHVMSKGIYISDPTDSEDRVFFHTPVAITITRIYGETDAGTVTFKIKWRAEGGAFAGGTEVENTALVADDTGEQQTAGFEDATIPAGSFLAVVTSAVAGAPADFIALVEFTVD